MDTSNGSGVAPVDMGSHSLEAFNPGGSTSSSSNNNNKISVESTAEWKIHDILFNGQERYLEPLIFSDHVAKLAHKVNWRDLIGDSTTRDDPDKEDESDSGSNDNNRKDGKDMAAADCKPGTSKQSKPSDHVGPWDAVAKRLHESVTEMNVLLDVLRMGQQENYLIFDPTMAAIHEDAMNRQRQDQVDPEARSQTLLSKRKSLSTASSVLMQMIDRSSTSKQQMGSREFSEGDRYLMELQQMREQWRLKKVGNVILGDLGYQPSGVKYRPNATFEVSRRSKDSDDPTLTCLEVSIPRTLQSRTYIRIYMIYEDSFKKPDFAQLAPAAATSTDGKDVKMELNDTAEDDIDGKERPEKKDPRHWRHILTDAQQTLINRDIFHQLGREAVSLHNWICIVQNNWMVVSIGQGFLLRLELANSSTPMSDNQNRRRLDALERNLRRLYHESLKRDAIEIPRPVTLPLYTINQFGEGAASAAKKSRKDAGPRAIPIDEDEELEKCLLEKLISMSEHVLLVRRTLAICSQFKEKLKDPQLLFNFTRTTPYWSIIRLQIATANFDYFGRSTFFIEIGSKSMEVIAMDGEHITVPADENMLSDILWIQCRTHQLHELSKLIRSMYWTTLFASAYTTSNAGNLLPTLVSSSQSGEKVICVRLPVGMEPEIYVQTRTDENRTELERKLDGFELGEAWNKLQGDFRRLSYADMIGNTLPHKLEFLLSSLAS